jgi:hypothetical protein
VARLKPNCCTPKPPHSIAKRENAAAMRKSGAMGISTDGKPTKKQRRQLHQFHYASGNELSRAEA